MTKKKILTLGILICLEYSSYVLASAPLENIIVIIDPGHGGKYNNAVAVDGTLEKNLNLDRACELARKLKEFGAAPKLTRVNDKELNSRRLDWDLDKRVKIANDAFKKYPNKTIIFISIHHNGFDREAEGTETYYWSPPYIHSKELAEKINSELVKVGFKDRGAKVKDYTVLRELDNKIHGILTEICFIDNQFDWTKYNSLKENRIANALLIGILRHLDLIKSTTIEAEAEENILTRCVRKDGWVKIGKDTGGYPVFVKQWGGRGSGDGQFRAISGMEVDKVNDVIYVTDFDNARLQKFSSDGNFLSKWVGFDTPWGIGVAVDSSGYVYVADAGLSCVYKFSSEGNLVTKWGSEGSGAGQFQNGPTDIYIDKLGNVYVTDTGNCRIQKFTSGGVFIKMWGGLGSGAGQFKYPYGIAGDDSGNIYVADSSNYRVQKFSSDGTFVGMWGGCDYPQGIAVDSTGNVYVGERFGGKKVKKFTSDGALLFSLSEFRYPIAIGIDLEDNIYIADGLTNYIKKFVYPASLSGVIETAWSGEENLFSFVEFLPVSIIPEETGAIEYECTTDGENWFDVPEDFNLMSVDASSRKIKFRITLSRISGEDESPALDKIVVEYVTTGEERADNGNTVRLLNTKGSAAQTPMKMDNENVFEFGEVYAYPNPARMKNPKIHIETGKADKATIKIYDMAGLPVHQVEMNHSPSVVDGKYIYEYLWDTSGVASGVYIYSVKISKEGEKDIQTVKRLALLK